MLVTLDSIRPLVRNTVVTTLSAVMSHVRGDISLVIRIATIIEIFGHILGISWAYLGHILGIFWASILGPYLGANSAKIHTRPALAGPLLDPLV